MKKMKTSITGKNTIITAIANIIQKSRIILTEENPQIIFSSDETRQTILICLLYLVLNKNIGQDKKYSLLSVIKELKINESVKTWIETGFQINGVWISKTISYLTQIKKINGWKELIDYSCEVLEYDVNEYFKIDVNKEVRTANIKKKNNGIYYTPEDVVEFMISRCLSSILKEKNLSILDCSCGSGIFLLRYLIQIDNIFNSTHNIDKSLNLLKNCIWGIDISKAAIDNCKFIFTKYYLDNYLDSTDKINDLWRIIDDSFIVGDSTRFETLLIKNRNLPSTYNCIIGNPPYVSIGRKSNLYVTFVENMIKYSAKTSCSALVLPLSICYSQGEGFAMLRKKIQEDTAIWEFYNYDRSPDSLFGDQVKTRNVILFRNSISCTNVILTTKLQRWTSEKRDSLFRSVKLCNISEVNISRIVPKISLEIEKQVFLKIRNGKNSLYKFISHEEKGKHILVMNGTAYNWICVYDHFPPSMDENGNLYKSNSCKVYSFADEDIRNFCIALLSNRIAYWYWTVIGDGFHFNTMFLNDYCMSKNDFSENQYMELCELGKEYSKKIKLHPMVSYNAKKKIINYSHGEALDIVEKIEKLLEDALNFPIGFSKFVAEWYFSQVHCDRVEEKR